MATFLQSALPFLVIIVFLVVVHELGHFLTAKAFGVKVLEFGVGYPPRIWGKRIGETDYTLNALPLGGFVRLLGEEDPSDPRSLAAQKRWVRILVMAAGAIMNAVLPVLLFTAAYMVPQEVPVGRAVITSVVADAPAGKAGLRAGDLILTINGHPIESTADASYYIHLYQGSTMRWEVRRRPDPTNPNVPSGIVELEVYGRWAPPPGQGITGITLAPLVGNVAGRGCEPASGEGECTEEELRAYFARVAESRSQPTETRWYPLWEAGPKAVVRTAESFILFRNQIITWIAGRTAPQLQGPVGIAQVTGEVVERAGWVSLLELAAQLSISLAIFNMLPVPMLDGGRIMFVLVEMLRGGKRVPPEKEALVHLAGFVLLIGMVVVISFFDIQRIVRGESLFR